MAPFLSRLRDLQSSTGSSFVTGRLSFLAHYESWITEAHVGRVSETGLRQTTQLGKAFRTRYKRWLVGGRDHKPVLHVWADSAARCHVSASAFAAAFSNETEDRDGEGGPDDGLQRLNSQVHVLQAGGPTTCNNLCWH